MENLNFEKIYEKRRHRKFQTDLREVRNTTFLRIFNM